MKCFSTILFLILICFQINCQILRVDVNTPCSAGCNGSSWNLAYEDLTSAIEAATIGAEIWVADGTYYPTKDPLGNPNPTNPRTKTFHLSNGIKIFGGFQGTETVRSMRNPDLHATILSGNIGDPTLDNDNVSHIIISIADNNQTWLDGFTIQEGYADFSGSVVVVEGYSLPVFGGAGIHMKDSELQIYNCKFINNFSVDLGSAPGGGGIYAESSDFQTIDCRFQDNARAIETFLTNSEINNCVFIENYDGVIYNSRGNIVLRQSEFRNNIDGVIFNYSNINTNSKIEIDNSLFSGNYSHQGIGIFSGVLVNSNNPTSSPDTSTFIVTNSTFTGNKAETGAGAINNIGVGRVYATNCIFWNDSSETSVAEIYNALQARSYLSHCLFDDGSPGSGSVSLPARTIDLGNNIDDEPLFIQPVPSAPSAVGNSRLTRLSPAIDAGDNVVAGGDDLDGNVRIFNGTVDMGCYEYQPCLQPARIIYVDSLATGLNNGTTWANAYHELSNALLDACVNDTLFIAKGTYFPDDTGLNDLRTATFHIPDSIILIGGFSPVAGDTNVWSRDVLLNQTILSGDIGIQSDSSDNCYHVLTALNVHDSRLDGFIIKGGNADHATLADHKRAGGLRVSNSTLELNNCILTNNNSTLKGSAIYNRDDNSILHLKNCQFNDNTADSEYAIYSHVNATTNILNCTFVNNNKCIYSGVFSVVNIYNSIFWGNGINPLFEEVIGFPGFIYANYSLIEGGYTGTANIDAYPQFTDTLNQDFSILPISPAVSAANNSAYTGDEFDLAGNQRIQQGVIDMGAFEANQCENILSALLYVDQSATGNNDGSSWTNAFTSFDSALLHVSWCDDTILVAEGTYVPVMHPETHVDAGRDNAFFLPPNVVLIGGFPSGGSDLASRDPDLYPTVLSAEVGLPDSSDNLYHVLLAVRDTSIDEYALSTIDGFTFTRANANNLAQPFDHVFGQPIARYFGGALFILDADLDIRNCVLINNYGVLGSAIYANDVSLLNLTNSLIENNSNTHSGAPIEVKGRKFNVSDCSFTNNSSAGQVGAIKISNLSSLNAEAIFTRCSFDGNSQSGSLGTGGAAYVAGTSSTFMDCIFRNNSCTDQGGAIWHQSMPMEIHNCLFYNNTAADGGAIYSRGNAIRPEAQITNSVIVDNSASNEGNAIYLYTDRDLSIANSVLRNGGSELSSTGDFYVTYSNIEGGYTGSGNIDADPQFVDATNNNYRLQITSPCINAGINDSIPAGLLFDLDGNPRINDDTVDMGAYEYLIDCIHPDYNALETFFNQTNGNSWTTKTGWLTDCDPCNWHGVTCDINGRVRDIDLQVNNLSGQLPQEITQLTELRNLWLGVNNIYGPIPTGFGSMPNLEALWLHFNNLSGTIPADIGMSTSLRRFYLYNNDSLTGTIPGSLGDIPSLIVLRTYNTGLSGCYDGNLENLCTQFGIHSTNANISDGTILDASWEDFCACNAGICPCSETNIWQGGVDNWDVAAHWSLGHVPRACETVQITNASDIVTVPSGYYPVIYLLEVNSGAELIVPAGQEIHVLADPGFDGWDVCD